MQLIVLGMRSIGTRVITRLLNMMGAYFGSEGLIIGQDIDDSQESWERKDLRDLCENTLMHMDAGLYRIADFSVEKFSDDIKAQFLKSVRALILELDAHRPWVINEPRLNLLLPLLREFLEVPVCIHVIDSPVKIAQYLQYYNGFPIKFGMALWEKYTISALSASSGLPRILLSSEGFMSDPVASTKKLHSDLCELEVQGIRMPAEKEIKAFIGTSFDNKDIAIDDSFINSRQKELIRLLNNKEFQQSASVPSLSLEASEVMFQFEDKERLESAIKEKYEENLKQKDALNVKEKELSESRRDLERTRQEVTSLQKENEAFKASISEKHALLHEKNQLLAKISELNEKIEKGKFEIGQIKNESKDLKSHLRLKETELLSVSKEKNTFSLEADKRQRETLELKTKLRELENSEHSKKQYIKKLEDSIQQYGHSVHTLIRWVDKLEGDFSNLLKSKRWQAGNAIIRGVEVLLCRKKAPIVVDHISKVLKEFQAWKKTDKKKLITISRNQGI